ncbi:MAG: hypothetical protein K0Q89_2475, partial [Thermomicrobiales bacterium]|nr:hypothetical protein [Thermomicrobiales bacterium]
MYHKCDSTSPLLLFGLVTKVGWRYVQCMTESVNIKAVRSNWQSRGFSCDVWSDRPGQVWNDYRHSVDEVVMVLE